MSFLLWRARGASCAGRVKTTWTYACPMRPDGCFIEQVGPSWRSRLCSVYFCGRDSGGTIPATR
jgi:hypothetical protein